MKTFTCRVHNRIRPYRDGPWGTEEPESPAEGRDHAGCAAAGGAAEHAGVAAEGDGQMFQEMHHQPGLLSGEQRPEMFISLYGQVRVKTKSARTLSLFTFPPCRYMDSFNIVSKVYTKKLMQERSKLWVLTSGWQSQPALILSMRYIQSICLLLIFSCSHCHLSPLVDIFYLVDRKEWLP